MESAVRGIRCRQHLRSSFDTAMVVYVGNVLTTEVLASNDDGCGRGSAVSFETTAGTTYRISVDGFGAEMGPFTLSWSFLPGFELSVSKAGSGRHGCRDRLRHRLLRPLQGR